MSERRCPGCGVPIFGHRKRKWCSEACRKAQYGGKCIDCGARTDGSNGRAAAPIRCNDCARDLAHRTRIWTPETIIEAIRAFAAEYGRPPAAVDWNVTMARDLGHDWRADRYESRENYPSTQTVQGEFGSWSAAIEAAGFPTYGQTFARVAGTNRGAHLEAERPKSSVRSP